MRSPLRFTLPLITHSGDGASDAETAPSRAVCAFTGTEAAPRIIVVLFRCRQSHGAINDPYVRGVGRHVSNVPSADNSYSFSDRASPNYPPMRASIVGPPDDSATRISA
jgi:hypothetical protein